MLNYPAIPIIVVICYIAITAIKSTKIDSRWYPPHLVRNWYSIRCGNAPCLT